MKVEPWYKDNIGGLAFCQAQGCLAKSYWQRYIEVDGIRYRQRACDIHAVGEGNDEFRRAKQPAHERDEECDCNDCLDERFQAELRRREGQQ